MTTPVHLPWATLCQGATLTLCQEATLTLCPSRIYAGTKNLAFGQHIPSSFSVNPSPPVLRIRDLFDPLIRDPRWVKNQDPDPGWSYFRKLRKNFWVKILWCGSGIRDEKIPDPQHCFPPWKLNRTKGRARKGYYLRGVRFVSGLYSIVNSPYLLFYCMQTVNCLLFKLKLAYLFTKNFIFFFVLGESTA